MHKRQTTKIDSMYRSLGYYFALDYRLPSESINQ